MAELQAPLPQAQAPVNAAALLSDLSKNFKKTSKKLRHVTPIVQSYMPEDLRMALGKDKKIDMTTKVPRFEINDRKTWMDYLNNNGYVVIKQCVNETELKQCTQMFWEWLESLPGDFNIDRNNPQTWHGNWPADSQTGIIFTHGIGQTEFCWKIRSFVLICFFFVFFAQNVLFLYFFFCVIA